MMHFNDLVAPICRLRTGIAVGALLVLSGVVPTPARADGPGAGTPWVVSVGDSYVSGEAGRWAGNTNTGQQYIDALGPAAYYDAPTGELIPRCHRSRAAEVHVGSINGLTLACSGAKTSTFIDGAGSFKPGLDFYSDSSGRKGQALMLQGFAATHNVKLVAVSVGGNNFNFADVVQTCLLDFLTSPSWWPNYCHDDLSVTSNFTAGNVAAQTTAIVNAIQNIRSAMFTAGYPDSAYTILVQDYESPIPPGAVFRYPQFGFTRQSVGGCGFWDADADWANATALQTMNNAVRTAAALTHLTNVKVLELASAFNGRRLCENTVGLLEEKGLTDWGVRGAVDTTEWINQIRTVTTALGDYYVQESLHPNYWAQLALRNCVRKAYNGGMPRGGTCTIAGPGLTSLGEPDMALT
jgi:hypothetical protein